MKILYIMGDCSSGVEQIGYVYLLLLKKLGHTIDLVVSQDMNALAKFQTAFKNYNAVVFNEPNPNHLALFNIPPSTQTYYIVHSDTPINASLSAVSLCINYPYHAKITRATNLAYPIPYPFAFKAIERGHTDRQYKRGFIGRYIPPKFNPKVAEAIKHDPLDYCFTTIEYSGLEIPAKSITRDASTLEVYEQLLETKFLILPSTTECFSLVVGEALVNGCIPIVLESEYLEHEQFRHCIMTRTVEEFIDAYFNSEFSQTKSNEALEWSNEMFSMPRCLYALEQFFGHNGTEGQIRQANLFMYSDRKPYKNAVMITSEGIK